MPVAVVSDYALLLALVLFLLFSKKIYIFPRPRTTNPGLLDVKQFHAPSLSISRCCLLRFSSLLFSFARDCVYIFLYSFLISFFGIIHISVFCFMLYYSPWYRSDEKTRAGIEKPFKTFLLFDSGSFCLYSRWPTQTKAMDITQYNSSFPVSAPHKQLALSKWIFLCQFKKAHRALRNIFRWWSLNLFGTGGIWRIYYIPSQIVVSSSPQIIPIGGLTGTVSHLSGDILFGPLTFNTNDIKRQKYIWI